MSKRTLLLADDSVTIQKVVNLTFADAGFEVISVVDGEAAMAKLGEAKPDLVLADVHMPGLSGYQVCDMIRQNESTRDVPVVLLVGSFEPFDEAEAARVGASGHLTKPFQSIKLLVDEVSRLTAQKSVTATTESPVAENQPGTQHAVHTAGPETSDIDNLYSASFAETIEIPAEDGLASDYVDAGMDDEIIETSYSAKHEAAAESESDPLQILETKQTPDPASKDTPHAVPDEEPLSLERSDESSPAISPFAEIAKPETPSPETTAAEPDHPGNIHDEFATTKEMPSVENGTFDDLELLELPPTGSDQMLEFTTEPPAAESSGKARAVSLSPELMEIIVQRVVDKLSEKE